MIKWKVTESEKWEAEGGDWGGGYKKEETKGSKRQNKLKVTREKNKKIKAVR